MGQISIILLAGMLFLLNFEQPETDIALNTAQRLLWTLALTVAPAFLAYCVTVFANRVLPADTEDNLPKLHTLKRFVIGFECLSLVAYLGNLYLLNLPGLIERYITVFPTRTLQYAVALVPLVVGLVSIRFAFYQVNRNEQVDYRELLSLQLKLLLFPIVPMFIYFFTRDVLLELPYRAKYFLVTYEWILIGVLLLPALAFVYLFAPYFVQFLWRTQPLPEGELKRKLETLTQRSGVNYKEIVVWQTGSLSIANAAVAGTALWNRRIFLTDALLYYFSDDEIETVVAHELGHIRYRHIPTYLLFSVIYMLSSGLFYRFVEAPLAPYLDDVPMLITLCWLVFFILYFVFIFRYLSRRFEHQADLYAVELTGKAEAFKEALLKLAVLNALPASIRRFFELFNTHPSIFRRIDFVDRVIAGSASILRYKRYLLEAKLLVVLLPIFGALVFWLV